jgi:hypothetical protein
LFRKAVTLSEILEAAQSGDRRATLEALRDQLAVVIDAPSTTGAELASLARQMIVVTEILEGISDGQAVNLVNDLAAKRASRKPGANASGRSAVGG